MAWPDKGQKGSYVLVLWLKEAGRLRVGKLGSFNFAPGHYLYFGSALNGLEGRLRRHLDAQAKCHWHIDFLTAVAPVSQVWWTVDACRWECHWAEAALANQGVTVPAKGFGSSDCRCPSHLVHARSRAEVEVLRRLLTPRPTGDVWTLQGGLAEPETHD